jgi:hypothetical protein
MANWRYLIAVLATGIVGAASAADLPNDVYHCTLSTFYLGAIEIEGSVYRGPAFDGNYDGDYPFQLTSDGVIIWGGPLGGVDSDGNVVVSTTLKDAGGGRFGFDIIIQNDRGNFQTISCGPE